MALELRSHTAQWFKFVWEKRKYGFDHQSSAQPQPPAPLYSSPFIFLCVPQQPSCYVEQHNNHYEEGNSVCSEECFRLQLVCSSQCVQCYISWMKYMLHNLYKQKSAYECRICTVGKGPRFWSQEHSGFQVVFTNHIWVGFGCNNLYEEQKKALAKMQSENPSAIRRSLHPHSDIDITRNVSFSQFFDIKLITGLERKSWPRYT